jgi:hypothetical protein
MAKTQKVRFSKSDRRPKADKDYDRLHYSKKMVKKGRKIIWQVKEKPTNNIIGTYFFEEDADKLVKFQNKNRVWEMNGGIPRFLWCNNI